MKKMLGCLCLLLITQTTFAVDKSLIKKEWQKTPYELYLNPQEAYDMKTAQPNKVLLLDVRNQAELHYVGMATAVDANVPYRFESTQWKMKRDGIHGTFKKLKNYDFAPAVEKVLTKKGLTKASPIIIMCTSGSRAPYAARALHKAGFGEVYLQIEGFEGHRAKSGPKKGQRIVNGWKNAGLPWSYDLLPEKMYFNFETKKK